jgi:hypothetical protein
MKIWFTAFVSLIVFEAARLTYADDWAPYEFGGALSKNMLFTCAYSNEQSMVSHSQTGVKVFAFTFIDNTMPLIAFVSNDGRHVIGIDRVGSEGIGPVMAIYSSADHHPRVLTLEDISGQDDDTLNMLLQPTVTRRPWARRSIMFFWVHREQQYFAVWMSWSAKWVLINLENGQVIRKVDNVEHLLRVSGFRVAKDILSEIVEGDCDVLRNVLYQRYSGDGWKMMVSNGLFDAAVSYINYLQTPTVQEMKDWSFIQDLTGERGRLLVPVGRSCADNPGEALPERPATTPTPTKPPPPASSSPSPANPPGARRS